MIDSKRKIVFVHINKTAGTSIERILFPDASVRKGRKHHTALWAKKFLHDKFKGYLRFSVVRNPWDRLVSIYRFRMLNRLGITHMTAGEHRTEFKQWWFRVRQGVDEASAGWRMTCCPQVCWLSDEPQLQPASQHARLEMGAHDAELLVEKVLRFENLQQDFADLAGSLSVQDKLPHVHPTAKDVYQKWYDDELAEDVARVFQPDLARFGYQFEK